MVSLRNVALALVATVVTGCGSPLNSENSSEKLHLVSAPSSGDAVHPAVPREAAAPQEQSESSQNEALKKVALAVTSVTDPKSSAYKIGPRDVLDISVFKVPELSKTVQVSEAGTISYPLVGELRAGGRTSREVEQELRSVLGAKYLQNPQINVFVREYNSQRVTLEGAIKKPGVYPIPGGMTLLQAVATAGGLEINADETVLLFRQSEGRRYAGRYDVGLIREGKADDPQLQSGDVIIAGTSQIKDTTNMLLRMIPLATIVPLL